ncbi:MAG: LPS export ABC transporter periplasmic protein LptC [Alphaproteobacteria bacterium]|nr:LPS export ABC transporter periplasmic protein LptC [Alphaproteobacteria bacterium]
MGLSLPKSYSRYVSLMKVILPMGIIIAIGLTFAWPYIISHDKEELVLIDSSQPEIQENRMIRPYYVSTDGKGQPFHVNADWAKQNSQTYTDLINPSGTLETEEGETLNLQAKEGHYNSESKYLDLEGKVTLTSTDGYRVQTEKAHVTFDNSVVEGDSLVEGEGPAGKLRGQNGFKIESKSEGKKIITLKGPSRIEINKTTLKKKKRDS